MRLYGRDLKLECLKLAMVLATSKAIPPAQVVTKAKELFDFVDADEDSEKDDPGPGA